MESLLSILGKVWEWVCRWHFARKYGGGAYDAVHGHELREFLDREYGQRSWSWKLKVLGVDRQRFEFKVRYDDCGAWAGVVAVAPHRRAEERFRIVRRDEREWPPPEWGDSS